MNIRIVKVDLSETNEQLRRIADLLERVVGATDPIFPAQASDFPGEEDVQRVFYTDDKQEIIDHHIRRIKRTPKP